MRFVNRNTVAAPASLAGPSASVQAEKTAVASYYLTYNPAAPGAKSFEFKEYKGTDVVLQLRTLFNNKCAYCEMELLGDLEVEHFRPKGKVTEEPTHSGYWWLAHTWTNLLPACAHCNKSRRQHIVSETTTVAEFELMSGRRSNVSYGKGNQFPIYGVRARTIACALNGELPKLLDPTVDDPRLHFKWAATGPYSIVLPLGNGTNRIERALASINIFALNRAELVRSRTLVLNDIKFQAAQIEKDLEEDLARGGSQFHLDRALRHVRELRRYEQDDRAYSEMAKSFIDEFESQLQARMA
jgi:uncharacterized protein (TIGR02646 family)